MEPLLMCVESFTRSVCFVKGDSETVESEPIVLSITSY